MHKTLQRFLQNSRLKKSRWYRRKVQRLPLHCLQLRPLLLRLLPSVALQAWSLSAYELNADYSDFDTACTGGAEAAWDCFAYPHTISFWRLKRFLQRTFVVLDPVFDLFLFNATHYAVQASRGIRNSRASQDRSQRPPGRLP